MIDCLSLRCIWSSAIWLSISSSFSTQHLNRWHKGDCKTRRETFRIWELVRVIVVVTSTSIGLCYKMPWFTKHLFELLLWIDYTPFVKSNGRFFSNTKITMMPPPTLHNFSGWIKCVQVVIYCTKYVEFCTKRFCTGCLNTASVIVFKSSLKSSLIPWKNRRIQVTFSKPQTR